METKARAIHVNADDRHAVAVGSLRVLVSRDGAEWFAQGVEIDFAASGSSLEDVQARFERGLEATIKAHLEKFGTIDRLLKYAPHEVWASLSDCQSYLVDLVTVHDLSDLKLPMPFNRIAYLEQRAA